MKNVKKVAVLTGTRADYGIYSPILEQIDQDPDLELQLLVTGMHLSPLYGMTINEIIKDGYRIDAKVEMLLQGSTGGNMARGIGLGILGLTQSLESLKPDLLVVLGDRGEMLAAAIAGSHLNIPIAHLHGGEVSGSIDESVRHAISKFAHIHFTSTEGSSVRLLKLGEDEWRIHRVGAPRIDTITSASLPSIEEVFENNKINLDSNDYNLVVFHPVTTETGSVSQQVRAVMQAVAEEDKDTIVILPNSDAGNEEILSVYEEYKDENSICFIKNLNHLEYLSVLKHSNALIGNSSSGIIEAASFKKPVLNIGSRQDGRERSGNVIDVQAEYSKIKEGLNIIKDESFQQKLDSLKNVYGEGGTSERIVAIIKALQINDKLLKKIISY